MLDVRELERRWFRYKLRRLIPRVLIAAATVGIAVGSFLFWPRIGELAPVKQLFTTKATTVSSERTETHTIRQTPPAPPAAAPAIASHQPVPAAEPAVSRAEPQMHLQPSMTFIEKLEAQARQPKPRPIPAPPRSAEPQPERTKPVEQPAPTRIAISQEEANDLKDVIRRFNTNKNPALSLFLARRYYDLQQYEHAYTYALRTNEIDSSVEESWLIFAKSLVKLNRKEEALKTLASYARHSGSAKAKALLDDIKKGTFR